MANDQWRIKLEKLLALYHDGLYSESELASACMGMLYTELNDQVWLAFPDWIQARLMQQLQDFAEAVEVLGFGSTEYTDVTKKLLLTKKWLASKGVLETI